MRDSNFAGTVVLLVEQGDEGSLGFVVNRPVGEVWPQGPGDGARVFWGGPVEKERMWCLSGWGADGEDPILPGVWWADPADVPAGQEMKLLMGYAGWSPGQLEGECEEGAWVVADGDAGSVFDDTPASQWARLITRFHEGLDWMRAFAADPRHN